MDDIDWEIQRDIINTKFVKTAKIYADVKELEDPELILAVEQYLQKLYKAKFWENGLEL